MKLFTRYTLVNLAANVVIFIVASVAFYFSLHYVLVHQIDEDLEIEEEEITTYVQKHDRLPESISASDQTIQFAPVSEPVLRRFTTVKMKTGHHRRRENFRRLTFPITAAGQVSRVEVSKSLEGTNSLLYSILLVSVLTILLILAVSALLNRFLLKRLWRPFYASLETIKRFRVSRPEKLSLSPTKTDEFRFMNQTLDHLAKSSRHEYVALKTFSENATHEIQTPIAIIRSKLDLLLQEESLSENGSKTLHAAFGALERLSRLNKSLLLLAKIENNQFEEVQTVDMAQRVNEKLAEFSELWGAKNITVDAAVEKATVQMNKELADVLLNNLLANATIHNLPQGKINVRLTEKQLSVQNTGLNPPLDTGRVFQRFYKPTASGGHNGLGLSIVKQICEASRFELSYRHAEGLHQFTVRFFSATG